MARFFLIDGHSLVFRAFFAVPDDMATQSGVVTNAVYGFTSMLVTLLRDHRPDGVAVAFDRTEPTFRHEMVDDYKAGRAETPDILWPQFDMVRRVVAAMGIPAVDLAGFEADDIVATLAVRAAARGDDAIVVTGDRDCYQLVRDPHIRVLYNRRGVSDYALYDEAGIRERTGVGPDQYVVYAALRGDNSDNLPGVPGVGEKTAAKLVGAYGDLDGIYAHLDELTPKLRENLAAFEDRARSNFRMMPLVTDLDLDLGQDDADLLLGRWDTGALATVCEELEFGGLRRRIAQTLSYYGCDFDADADAGKGVAPSGPVASVALDDAPTAAQTNDARSTHADPVPAIDLHAAIELERPEGVRDASAAVRRVVDSGFPIAVAGDWEGDPGRSDLRALVVLSAGSEGGVAGVLLDAGKLRAASVLTALASVMSHSDRHVVAHGGKELMRTLIPSGVDCTALRDDTAVAAYLLDTGEGDYSLAAVVRRFLPGAAGVPNGAVSGGDSVPAAESAQLGLGIDDATALDAGDADAIEAGTKLADAARMALALAPVLRSALESEGMLDLYEAVEVPLVRVLAVMEVVGIGVDRRRLEELSAYLTDEVAALERSIHELAGEEFKVNSTPQLRHILYEKLGLTPLKKTKTGFSTDAASLERMIDDHPIVPKLLRYREVEKLRSTYGTGLLSEVGPDGRIHASFNQTVARTGRLSSDRPNLHNIPVRTEEGRKFREAFVPATGTRFLVADYNQIELRVIAHLSGDPGLVEAFRTGADIHATTASRIFGVPPDDVTVAQRSKAKMVSYGLAYGMEAFGLAGRLGIPVDEASQILSSFFVSFPEVKAYMDDTVARARACGYTETELGRRRYVPDLQSGSFHVRQQAERQAMNAGIQGLAADIFKIALLRLSDMLRDGKLQSRVVLQVHDEVILEVPPAEKKATEELARTAMEHAYDMTVPLAVNVAWGTSWAAAKS